MAINFNRIIRETIRALGDVVISSATSGAKRTSSRAASSRSASRSSSHSTSSCAPSQTRGTPRRDDGPTGAYEVEVAAALARASYEPSKEGNADPSEVVWTWVPFQEDPNCGKDRPVVVIGCEDDGVYAVQLTSKDHDIDAEQEARWGRYWLDIGTGPWDAKGRPSEVRLDRALWVPVHAVRREGATLPKATWERIVAALREHA